MALRGTTFVGFGIRIDILAQGALFAFQQLSLRAAALAGIISTLAMKTMEFERAMADVERMIALNNKSLEGLSEISDTVREQILYMSSQSIYSVRELAGAFEFLLRAGMGVNDAMKELWRTEQLALATGMELNLAASTRIRILNMWASAGYKIVKLNDQLAQSEIEFTMTTEQLMTALNMVGASAAIAGLSFAETATMIGELIASGKSASKAGTTLRAAFKALVDPSVKAKQAMSEIGLSWDYLSTLDIAERMKVVGAAILALGDPTTRLTYSMTIFKSRASEILPVLSALQGGFYDTVERIEDAAGAAAVASQAFRENLSIRIQELNNFITANIIRVGEWLLHWENFIPVITAATLAVAIYTGGIDVLTKKILESVFATRLKAMWDAITTTSLYTKMTATWGYTGALLAEKLGLKATTTEEQKATVSKWLSVISTTGATISSVIYATTLGAMTFALKIAKTAVIALNKALGPVGWIIMAVALAIGWMVKNTNFMQIIMEAINPILKDFGDIFKLIGLILKTLMNILGPILKALCVILLPILRLLIIPLKIISMTFKLIASLLVLILKPFEIVLDMFAGLFDITKLLAPVMKVFGFIIKGVAIVFAFLVNVVIMLVNALISLFNMLGASIEKIEKIDIKEFTGELEEESGFEKERKGALGTEPDYTDFDTEDSGDFDSPAGVDEPVGAGSTRTTGGGRGGGDGGITINIEIKADIAEMLDEEAFAEYVAQYALEEYRRMRGITI